ncbi:uncharacterized protein FA14DRAFT_153003 [Meira miltonrushii]|uniref:Uncharacterized protein n=1 Tax=Meira miltonrushii TaxID=1280837 RepID=A0A316VIY8_9BASI|nr:uncharacterized protein FA14DRAFT_153003 [Meira miltonrushii]PWN37637.1 hypothetical protein FA14DRAFT_153003 [Meira miltonrushii]
MPSWTTKVYERRGKMKINTPTAKALRFFQKEPEHYMSIADLKVVQQNFRNDESGEWKVAEDVGLSCFPRTHYRIRWNSTESGAKWQSWALLGVYVENTFAVRSIYSFDSSGEVDKDLPSSKVCIVDEYAILQCPIFIYPFVKHSFNKAHDRLHHTLKCTLSQTPTSSP